MLPSQPKGRLTLVNAITVICPTPFVFARAARAIVSASHPSMSLDALVNVRSQLALGLQAYLQSFVDLSAWPASSLLGSRTLLSVYQSPDVIRWDRLDKQGQARRRDADRLGEFVLDDERTQRVPWADEREQLVRAVILGRPGEGKTTLTQLTCRRIAEQSLRALTERTTPLADVPIPIWLTVKDVRTAGSVDAEVRRAIPAAVARAVHEAHRKAVATDPERAPRVPPSPTYAADHILASWKRASTWLFLDALDEPSLNPHVNAATALNELATLPCHMVVTSRPYGYTSGALPWGGTSAAAEYVLAGLTTSQRQQFVRAWFGDHVASRARAAAFVEHAQFRDMASIGLLLTLICAVTERHPDLDPETTRRVHLYDRIVRDVAQRPDRPDPIGGGDELDRRLMVLERAALALFERRRSGPGFGNAFTYTEWHEALTAAAARIDAPRFVGDLEHDVARAGLIVEPATGQRAFLHRTFFEFFAAARIARHDPKVMIDLLASRVADADWREVVLLAIAHVSLVGGRPEWAGEVIEGLLGRFPGSGSVVALLGEAASEIVPLGVREPVLATLRPALIGVMLDGETPPKIRATAGTALGRIGDPRFHGEKFWCLPKDVVLPTTHEEAILGFVKVRKGPFLMGSDEEKDSLATDSETQQRPVDIAYDYWMARWPTTVAQFAVFVKWWDTAAPTERELVQPGRTGPWDDRGCLEGVANHPVVYVSWYDARAYCAWLTSQASESGARTPADLRALLERGYRFQLPNEAEWEKAARGLEGWFYPWGNEFDQKLTNCWDDEGTALKATSAVGCFAGGRSPFGVEDAAGNVWEWTRSVGSDRYDPNIDHYEADRKVFRVVRGGSCSYSRSRVRAACRYLGDPVDRFHDWGFRVVLSPIRS